MKQDINLNDYFTPSGVCKLQFTFLGEEVKRAMKEYRGKKTELTGKRKKTERKKVKILSKK